MRSVIIYRDRLLPLSETFIRAQVRSMSRFRGIYAGCRRTPGLDLSGNPVVLLGGGRLGRIREVLFKEFGSAPQFLHHLREYQPSLLHAHFGPDGAAAFPLAHQMKIPVVITFHGFDANFSDASFRQTRWGKRYLRRREALKSSRTYFLAVSQFIADKLTAQGFPRDRVHVHYIGVDTAQFQYHPRENREPVVLFVGRLVEKKGCDYLLGAMAKVQQQVPHATCVVIGDGPLRHNLESLANLLSLKVKFLGAQDESVIRDWMTKAMVFCAPSIVAASGDAEGFGIVFIEAQASGLPVVSFASGGVPEAVCHDQTGYLAPEKSIDGLAGFILKLLQDPDTWQKFSTAGRKRTEQMFNLKLQTEKLERIYEQLLPEGPC